MTDALFAPHPPRFGTNQPVSPPTQPLPAAARTGAARPDGSLLGTLLSGLSRTNYCTPLR